MKKYTALVIYLLPLLVNAPRAENRVDLGSQTLSNIRGNLNVNMVAGDDNQQANLAAIAVSGATLAQSSQKSRSTNFLTGKQSVAINNGALSQSQGHIAINQGAGEANQQLNVLSVSLEGDALTDINLSNTTAKFKLGKETLPMTTSIYLDSNALASSKGAIQINQVTGQGNQAVNLVSLPLAGAVTVSP